MNRLCKLLMVCLLALPLQNKAQELSADQWQEDLRHLQKTIHQEYPFLFLLEPRKNGSEEAIA